MRRILFPVLFSLPLSGCVFQLGSHQVLHETAACKYTLAKCDADGDMASVDKKESIEGRKDRTTTVDAAPDIGNEEERNNEQDPATADLDPSNERNSP